MGSTDFNLEQSIANHVQLIKGQGSTTSSDEAELTAHLHDACEDLLRNGLSEEEAFIIARRRLGDMEVLTEEYGKVNTTVNTNKVWAYLLIGASLIPVAWQLLTFGGGYFYLTIYKYFGTSAVTVISATVFNVLLIGLVWYSVKRKQNIARYLEDQVAKSPIQTVLLSLVPLVVIALVPSRIKSEISSATNYPVYMFQSDIAGFSLYLLMFSLAAGFLSLVFSLKSSKHISLKSLFVKPSTIFLLSFGLLIELLAASTRGIHIESILGRGFIFGLVYLAASFLIAYYNHKESLRYLLVFSLIGFVLEVSVGVAADIARGDTIFTAYFASGLVLGVLAGAALGSRMKQVALAG